MSKQERTSTNVSVNEPLLFELGSPGRRAFDLPKLDVPPKNVADLVDPALLRDDLSGMPELSEVDVIRHFTRISTWNYHIDLGLYPLGSCTMKYNPKINERMARLEGFALAHPYLPAQMLQGALEVQKRQENCLAEISGRDEVTLQQAAAAHGGLVYLDGANLNAMMGITRPGDFGIDVLHINLHKTFTTPHGGGGPGAGPVAVKKILEPFLPHPVIEKKSDGTYSFNHDRPQSIGKIKAYNGQFGMHVRALCYILANGPEGLKEVSEVAVLNANYIRAKLQDDYALAYDSPSLHEVVFSDRLQARKDVHVWDIAKRLMDYGFHPPTVSFPLIVPGAIMIEPTESESRQELDAFVQAMLAIDREAQQNPEIVKSAPHTTRIGRIDEAAAARKPILRWRAE